MTTSHSVFEPIIEAALMPHDGVVSALHQLRQTPVLAPETAASLLLDSNRYPYTGLTTRAGTPYLESPDTRLYLWADTSATPLPAAGVFAALQCSVSHNNGVKTILPTALWCDLPLILSMRFTCCSRAARFIWHIEPSPSSGAPFANRAQSAAGLRPEMAQIISQMKIIKPNGEQRASLAALYRTFVNGRVDPAYTPFDPSARHNTVIGAPKLAR